MFVIRQAGRGFLVTDIDSSGGDIFINVNIEMADKFDSYAAADQFLRYTVHEHRPNMDYLYVSREDRWS